MTWWGGLQPDEVLGPPELLSPAREPVPFWDAAQRAWDDTQKVHTLGAREGALADALWVRHHDIERRLARKLPDVPTGREGPRPSLFGIDLRTADEIAEEDRPTWNSVRGYELELEKLRAAHPEEMRGVLTREEVRQNVDRRLTGVAQRAAEGAEDHPVAGILGGVGAAVVDPTNVFVGVNTAGIGTAWPLLGRMAFQGGLWGAVTALQAPLKAEEARRVGGPAYGTGEAAADIAMAAAGGPLFEAGFSGLGWALKAAMRRATPALADPAARGIAGHIDALDRDMAFLGDLDGEGFEAAIAALDAGHPPPVLEPDQNLSDLFGEPAIAPRVVDGGPVAVTGRTEYRGRPIEQVSLEPSVVDVDPGRFQYKAEGDAQGVTARLRGVEAWDATASGKAIFWADETGKIFVADGHQRRALALRMQAKGWDARLDGFLFREADGWTARQVRTVAALKNIREGSGTILDAAKIFRDAPEAMADKSLPVTGDFIHQARGLARLSPEAFGAVVNKVIPERYGALIGEFAGDRPDLHAGMVRLLKEGEPGSADEAAALVREALLDDWVKSEGEQADFFGGLPPEATTISRAKVKSAIVRALRTDARIFGQLIKHADAIEAGGNALARNENEAAAAVANAALELVSRLALRSGDVGTAVAEAAARVRAGEAPGVAARGLIQRIKNALRTGEALDGLRIADIDPPAPTPHELASVEAFDDVAGEGAKAQAVAKPEDAAIEAAPALPEVGAGDLWRQPRADLEHLLAEAQMSDRQKLVLALGEDGAAEFEQLDRRRNSLDPLRADEAGRLFDEKFGALTPEQDRLIYGIGETTAQAEDIEAVLRAHGDVVPGDDADWLGYVAALGARKLTAEDMAAVKAGRGSTAAQAAFVRMQGAYEAILAGGRDANDIPRMMVDALVNRAGWTPEQAAEIIGSFLGDLKAASPARPATPAREALPPPGLFDDITDDAAPHEAALARLKPCAPGA